LYIYRFILLFNSFNFYLDFISSFLYIHRIHTITNFILLWYDIINHKQEKLIPSAQIEKDSMLYREGSDIVLQFFADKCKFEKGNKDLKVFATVLFAEFEQWKVEERVSQKVSKKEFYSRVDKLSGYSKDNKVTIDGERFRGWISIEINN
jgi:phage/plasmid-associated DNA primase